jgi:ribulose 1,5-bisphosphate synthetase/thiazole synthase
MIQFRCHQAVAGTSAQHAAQRLAPSGIAVKQCGQSFVFGGGGGAARKRLMVFTIRKTTKAIIKKVITSLRNVP